MHIRPKMSISAAISKRDQQKRARGNAAGQARTQLKNTMQKLTMIRACVRCESTYRELDNLGAWRCRYHPGVVFSEHFHMSGIDAGHYSCCNSSRGTTRPLNDHTFDSGERFRAVRHKGCAKCDHVSTWSREHEARRIMSKEQAHALLGSEDDTEDYLCGNPGRQLDERTGTMLIVRHEYDDVHVS